MTRIYFAHPEELRNPGRKIAEQMRAAGFDVYDPLENELSEKWRRHPFSKLAVKIWNCDMGELERADAVLAWLPRNAFAGTWREGSNPPIGTQMEIAVTMIYRPRRLYIVTDIFHPFLAATGRCFPTIEKALAQMKEDVGRPSELTERLQAMTRGAPERGIYLWKFPKMAEKRSLNTPPGTPPTRDKRGLDELIERTWRLIDQASERLADPKLRENDKIRWAGVLASAIGALNKLLWKAGAGQMEEDDLAQILSKIPKKYAKMIQKKIGQSVYDFEPKSQEEILRILKTCKRGQPLLIHWSDACGVKGVEKVTQRAVETPVVMVGIFDGVYVGKKTKKLHLLTWWMDADGKKTTDSTPIGMISDIKFLEIKEARKMYKDKMNRQWTSVLPGGEIKFILRRRKK